MGVKTRLRIRLREKWNSRNFISRHVSWHSLYNNIHENSINNELEICSVEERTQYHEDKMPRKPSLNGLK